MSDQRMTQAIDQIAKMLRSILLTNGNLHYIGGYTTGETKAGDPYVILYPAAEYLDHKVCRVYPHEFKKLPSGIDTAQIDDLAGGGNPDKSQAQKMGIYRQCPVFAITTYDGKETQMGREKRFADVLFVTQQQQRSPAPDDDRPENAPPAPQPRPEAQQPRSLSNVCSQAQRLKIDALAGAVYGSPQTWNAARPGLAREYSRGETDNILQITPNQADRLIAALEVEDAGLKYYQDPAAWADKRPALAGHFSAGRAADLPGLDLAELTKFKAALTEQASKERTR